MTTKAQATLGWGSNPTTGYHSKAVKGVGIDFEGRDGKGNIIKVSLREGTIGSRVEINGKERFNAF